MRKSRVSKVIAGAFCAAVAVTTSIGVAAPASAAGYMYLWANNNFSYAETHLASNHANFFDIWADLFPLSQGFNDKASSLRNSSDRWWLLYKNTNYTGEVLCVAPGAQRKSLSAKWNNQISSAKSSAAKPKNCTTYATGSD